MPGSSVQVRRESVVLPTYAPAAPQKNPLFLEHRVYQGSSGRVYPLPVIDRVDEHPEPRTWDAVWLENDFVRVMILPQIGGRIHAFEDKTNGYDLIYRQGAIKPALVGLAGPWLSGGIEFNWPQHHRPATYCPVNVEIEEHADGSKTVWLSDHDPMLRMKGMHGVCLHPERAVLELKVRAYNRTPLPQTFLWWANVATEVNALYQSFFPPDVHYVADHAKRAMSTYPCCSATYYGVKYGQRRKQGIPASERPTQFLPPYATPDRASPVNYRPDDLSWYANIPVPTSYMAMGSREDFFGGYDHGRRAGLVHVANHHISPGKKQWTWGNSEFGYAWDRNLTVPNRDGIYPPYIEIMAGVYTDNQPDFSFLQPGETKTWRQFWYPIREIGPAQAANVEAALSIGPVADGKLRIGVAVTRPRPAAHLTVTARRALCDVTVDLAPDRPHLKTLRLPRGVALSDIVVTLRAGRGGEILLRHQPQPKKKASIPLPASEPAAPESMASTDQLYLTGLHLDQYRHATRKPEAYWREGLRRDPGDARCNLALGGWHFRRGEFEQAERHLRRSMARLTERNPNPADGEPWYLLGLTLRSVGRDDEAYDVFYKATWNQAWQAAAFHALAEIDCTRGAWAAAIEHLERALRVNMDNLRARNLLVMVWRRLGRDAEAEATLRATRALDRLDAWARHLAGEPWLADTQTRLDVAHDLIRAGFHSDALALLTAANPEPHSGTAPLVAYTAAWVSGKIGDLAGTRRWLKRARAARPEYCFPARLEEIGILDWAIGQDRRDGRAPYYLGNLLYDRRRYEQALERWEMASRLDPANAVVWRNLGLAYYNVRGDRQRALRAYDRALRADPEGARVLFERDQLWKRVGESPLRRRRELERFPALVAQRDDLTLELCGLYNLTGRPEKAAALLAQRRFQPWEGGEGQALGQHVAARLRLGRAALARGDAAEARRQFALALTAPENLGESRHPLANASDVHYWLGVACAAGGDTTAAQAHWREAATASGDFQEMSVRAYSEMTYYSALASLRLGEKVRGRMLLRELRAYALQLERTPARLDYFATSLPTMLLFNDDLDARQRTTALFLRAQAEIGLGRESEGRRLLRQVLRRDPAHAAASDLLSALQP